MPVDPLTLAAARGGSKEALAHVLAVEYPQVWRMAVNLTGREPLGREVTRAVMQQALLAAPSWEHEDVPARWFRHHTVLAAREAAPAQPPAPAEDVLLAHGPKDAGYLAFVRAIRGLEKQQREAFLLNHGEDFDLRQLGIAMDCSVEAAGVHLRTASLALQALAGGDFGRCVQAVRAAYRASVPDESMALPYARKLVRPGVWTTLAGIAGWIVLLALLSAIAWGAWWLWPRLVI